ncbi:putative Myb/SANT-like domain-containing protein [Helianthus annuus]|uniref:Myb/SANT-like domain-containing protein n=2 Tax=Helianthus annuus TaxID=4232 RepID=A0A9K3DRK1_HELAN|nr:putative Myb/SANT-like domain-containing protein [Helianthus annuus]
MAEKKIRINWKQEGVGKTFLESCIHEIALHGREGSSLKAISWKRVAEKLKIEHDFIVDQKQMKNRYDYLKSKFAAWSKLKNKTGNVYNPQTNTFNLTEEEWQLESKSNKFVEKLRRGPLDYPDLCIQLFEGSTSNGFDSWGPSSTIPHPSVEMIDQIAPLDIDGTQMEHGASEESSDRSKHKRKSSTEGVSYESSGRSKKGKQTFNAHLMEVGEDIRKVANMLLEKHNQSNDIHACMEKMETLGWEESDAKYQTAIFLFGESADLRKVWLELKPHTCEMWVKNAGTKYGLF